MKYCLFLLISIALRLNCQTTSLMVFNEEIPINNNYVRRKVLETLEKMQRVGVTPENLIDRAQKYFPYFDYELGRYGVHNDFKYLAVVESNLNNESKSNVGAGGLWQIMPATARELGLVVNSQYDERYHVKLSTQSAMLYLSRNYKVLKNWTLTAASYNCGLGCIQKEVANSGKRSGFYDLKLNKETTEYIYKIIVVKYMFEMYFNKQRKLDIVGIKKEISNVKPTSIPQTDSCIYVEIKKEQRDSIVNYKKVELKYLSTIELKNDIEQNMNDKIKLKYLKGGEKMNMKNIYYPFISEYSKEDERAYFSMSGIELGIEYADKIIKVYDEDGNLGLSIPDYQGKLPRNIKLKAKLYEYE